MVPVKIAFFCPASTSTSPANNTGAFTVTPSLPRNASRSVKGPALTVAVTDLVNAASAPNLMESISEVTRAAATVPDSTTRPAHPELPGLFPTATEDTVGASNFFAPKNHGSPDT